jgi:hypothetical protein
MDTRVEASGIKTPFNAYDVFAYFMPGLALFTLIYVYESRIQQHAGVTLHAPVYHFLERTQSVLAKDTNWAVSLVCVIAAIGVAYVVGHIVASLSALIIDRVLVYKGYGYPYENLLELPDRNRTPLSSSYYKGMFCWINIILLEVYYSRTNLPQTHLMPEIIKGTGVFLIVVTILKTASSFVMHEYPKLPGRIACSVAGRVALFPVHFLLVRIFPALYDVSSMMLANFIRTQRGMDRPFIDAFKLHYKTRFKQDADIANTNAYWMPYCHVAEKSPTLYKLAMNWFNLFSLSRNLTVTLYIAFIYSLTWLYFQGNKVHDCDKLYSQLMPALFYCGSMLLLVRYYYLYSSYYSKFLFRAFVYLETTEGR